MKAFYCDQFVLPLPETHSFPMAKYRKLRERVLPTAIIDAGRDLPSRRPRSFDQLTLAHDAGYVADVFEGRLTARAPAADRVPVVAGAWSSARGAASAGRLPRRVAALRRGRRGEPRRRHPPRLPRPRRGLLRLQRHRGRGARDARAAATHGRRRVADCRHRLRRPPGQRHRGDLPRRPVGLHPLAPRREELPVPQGDERPRRRCSPTAPRDDEYLARARRGARRSCWRGTSPDFVFYLAGADPFGGDRLGRLTLTIDGLRARDRAGRRARARGIPIAACMGGGYCRDVDVIVEIHANTVREISRADFCCPKLTSAPCSPMPDLIDAMEAALIEFSAGRAQQPLRTVLAGRRSAGVLRRDAGVHARHAARSAPSWSPSSSSNAARGLPTHLATIVLLDPRPARCRRSWTAATSPKRGRPRSRPSSAKHLARPDAGVLALIGSGRAGPQPPRGAGARPRARARSGSGARTPTARAAFVDARASPRVPGCAPAARRARRSTARTSSRSCRRRASRSCAATGSRDGAHICAVGACRPDQREMDTALVRRRARVRGFARSAALAEAGDIAASRSPKARSTPTHIAGELGELAGGHGGRPQHRRTRSRSSSRWGWRSRTWRPRTWRSSARRRAGSAEAVSLRSYLRPCGARPSASSSSRRSACGASADILRRVRWRRPRCGVVDGARPSRDARAAFPTVPAACRLGVQRGQPLAGLRDLALEPAERPADQLGRLDQHVVAFFRGRP